jgi:hypothetical protein
MDTTPMATTVAVTNHHGGLARTATVTPTEEVSTPWGADTSPAILCDTNVLS